MPLDHAFDPRPHTWVDRCTSIPTLDYSEVIVTLTISNDSGSDFCLRVVHHLDSPWPAV